MDDVIQKTMPTWLQSTLLVCCLGGIAQDSLAYTPSLFAYPLYLGVKGGIGSTTWQYLEPAKANEVEALMSFTPSKAHDLSSTVWGVYLGAELIPTFAIEAGYTHYPNTKLEFDPYLAGTDDDPVPSFITHTDTVNLSGKLHVFIPHTDVRVFSMVGVAGVHRRDFLKDDWFYSPTFDLGVTYNFTPHIMWELGFNYTAGYAESELSPAQDFYPFLYSGYLSLAYRF